ncbi:MAG: hypothetical protein V4509_00570 [Patescibacteria group bacterium]
MTQNKKELQPIKVNKDVWFYKNPKTIEFVVWTEVEGKRNIVCFKVLKSKFK